MNKGWYIIIILFLLPVIFSGNFFGGGDESLSEDPFEIKENIADDGDISSREILPATAGRIATSTAVFENPGLEAPDVVKAVYLTGWSASNPYMVNYVVNLAQTTEINAVVVDVKDWSGKVFYNTGVSEAEEYGAEIMAFNPEKLVERFHEKGVYVIARITLFQDPVLANAMPEIAVHQESDQSQLWLDKSGLAWIDPTAKPAWEYNVSVAKDAWSRGFDELNFDYIRFPTDGDLKNMSFPVWNASTTYMHRAIKDFYGYLREELPDAVLSVDLFGLSTVMSNFGVGQNIDDAFPFFDFVCPMVYPSHFADGFIGYDNPAEYPYEVVSYSMASGLRKLKAFDEEYLGGARLRPWLQDFDLGAEYGAKEVLSEINAVFDALGDDFSGFMLWNPNNIYSQDAVSSVNNSLND